MSLCNSEHNFTSLRVVLENNIPLDFRYKNL